MDMDRQLEINAARHHAADMRYLDKLDLAYTMIGELCREGKPIFYVWPIGGRYREGTQGELADFLIRNRYV